MNVEKNGFIEIIETPASVDVLYCVYHEGSFYCATPSIGSSMAATMSGKLVDIPNND